MYIRNLFKYGIFFVMTAIAWPAWSQVDLSMDVISPNPLTVVADGSPANMIFRVQDVGPTASSDATVMINIDPSLIPFDIGSVNPPGNWTCNTTTLTIDCSSNGPVPAGSVFDFTIDITAPQSPMFIPGAVTAIVGDTAGTDINSANDQVSVGVDAQPAGSQVDLNMNKTLSPGSSATVMPGDVIRFDLTVNNPTTTSATAILMVDHIDLANLVFVPSQSSPECFYSTPDVLCNLSFLAANDSHTFTVAGQVPLSQTPGTQQNDAGVSASEPDPNTVDNFSGIGFNVIAPADISVVKTINGGFTEFQLGDVVDYEIAISNTESTTSGPSGLVVQDVLPPEVTFNSLNVVGSNFFCNHNAGVVSCSNTAPFPALATDTVHVFVQVTSGADGTAVDNAAELTVPQGDPNPTNDFSVASFDIIGGAADPEIRVSKTITGNLTEAVPGELVEYVVLVKNETAATAADTVNLTDTLPPEVSLVSFTPVGPNFTCTFTAPTLLCSAGTLPNTTADDGVKILVEVIGTSGNQVNNTASSDFVDTNTVNNSDSVSFTIVDPVEIADLSLTHSSDGATFQVGDVLTFTTEVINPPDATGEPSDVSIQHTLPAQTAFINAELQGAVGGWNCQHDGSSAGGVVSCSSNGNALPVNSHVVVRVSAEAVAEATSVSSDAVVFSELDNNPDNNADKVDVSIIAQGQDVVDLGLIKQASSAAVQTGDSLQYLLTVQNLGTVTVEAFTLTDNLPDGVLFQGFSGSGWSCSGDTSLSCDFAGTLSPDQSTVLTLDVLAPEVPGVIENTAAVDFLDDAVPGNNSDSVAVEVTAVDPGEAMADLSISKSATQDAVQSGQTLSWIIQVENLGPDAASGVQITDALPAGFEFSMAQGDQGDVQCNNNADTLLCQINALAVHETRQVTVAGTVTALPGTLENTAQVSSASTDNVAENNESKAQVAVLAVSDQVSDVSVRVLGEIDSTQQGSVVDFTVQSRNTGPDPAINAQLKVQLDGLIENVQLLETGGWQCNNANSTLMCQWPTALLVDQTVNLKLRVLTQQVVQQSQNLSIHAEITSANADPNPGNNSDSKGTVISATPGAEEIRQLLDEALGSAGTAQARRAIRNVSSYCARSFFTALEGICGRLIEEARNGNGQLVRRVMKELTPSQVIAQSSSATEIINTQFANITSRLAELRGGAAGFSMNGLSAQYGDQHLPLNLLAYMADGENAQAVDVNNDFISPWGFFINGTISMGDRDATGRELGFDFDTYGLTAGVDYRLSDRKVLGMALGYARFDSTIEDEAKLESSGVTLTGYGSFYFNDNFYMDARISYVRPDFDQKRRIEFEIGDDVINRTAVGNTRADQYTAAMSFGYHFYKNSWNITPNASIRYVRTNIDGFNETGAGAFGFEFYDQEIESLLFSAGLRVSRAISLDNGVITPQFDFDYSHEAKNDSGFIEARFLAAPEDEIFLIETDSPDRTYGSAGLGFVYISANGRQFYMNYRSTIGLEGFSQGTINLGGRIEF